MGLNFNAPVTRKMAEGIRLKFDKDSLKPTFAQQEGDADSVVDGVSFKPLFPELTQFTLELPSDFKDASGRALRNGDSFPLKVATSLIPQRSSSDSSSKASPPMLYSPNKLIVNGSGCGVSSSPITCLNNWLLAI